MRALCRYEVGGGDIRFPRVGEAIQQKASSVKGAPRKDVKGFEAYLKRLVATGVVSAGRWRAASPSKPRVLGQLLAILFLLFINSRSRVNWVS